MVTAQGRTKDFKSMDEMMVRDNTAAPKPTGERGAVRTLSRCVSCPNISQRVSEVSEGRSRSLRTEPSPSGNSSEDVNLATTGIKMINIKGQQFCRSSDDTQKQKLTEPSRTNQDTSPCRGLRNLGATCYLNASLQVLFMTKAFREEVLHGSSNTNAKLVSALKQIFNKLKDKDKNKQHCVSTDIIIKALGISVYEQQDAVEYFIDILEKVGHTLAKVFSGTLKNIRCCSENHSSYDESPFKALQISINTTEGLFRLEDGLDSYFESTTLDEDNQMYCETCDGKRDTRWSCEILKYPTILTLHLKRFWYDYRYGYLKNDCPMDVPLHLSLQEHEYSLYAVINHRGSRFGGHYTAVIRCFTNNKWYCFDDSCVTETDESQLKRSREAYLLLYQKNEMMVRDNTAAPKPTGERGAVRTLSRCVSCPNISQRVSEVSEGRSRSLRTEPSPSAPSDVKVGNVEQRPKTEPAELGEAGKTEQSAGAHNKPLLEASAVTGRLRILVLGRSKTGKKTLAGMILNVLSSSKPQLQYSETIEGSLEMCRPGPHMVLWVAPLQKNKKEKEAFEVILNVMGKKVREYIMIVFISEGPSSKNGVKNAMQNYGAIKKKHVLNSNTDLLVQVKDLVAELRKIICKNWKVKKPYYKMRKHKVGHPRMQGCKVIKSSEKKKKR